MSESFGRNENFGRNVRLAPAHRYAPRSDEEVLDILRRHGGNIRCAGALHSWSRILETREVLLDMQHFDSLEVVDAGAGKERTGARVRLGAGCTIKRALELLEPHGLTLPTVGAITKQTIAGAISTGTHGSGSPSLSHFVEQVRLACFDPVTKQAAIMRFGRGDERLAARCALGNLGVVLDVVMSAVRTYRVEERFEKLADLQEVKRGKAGWPLEQFVLLPWAWRYLVYRRRPTRAQGKRLRNLVLRAKQYLLMDVALHCLLRHGVLRIPSFVLGFAIRCFYRVVPFLIGGHQRIDRSDVVLTLHHDLFRHVEMEAFVPERTLEGAVEAIRGLAELGAGRDTELARRMAAALPAGEADSLRGKWTLHYPISFRRVLPDDTLISMASGGAEPWIAISLFTYELPLTAGFVVFARSMAAWLRANCEARLHWGKYFPVPFRDAAASYPRFAEFEEICLRYDSNRVFWSENL